MKQAVIKCKSGSSHCTVNQPKLFPEPIHADGHSLLHSVAFHSKSLYSVNGLDVTTLPFCRCSFHLLRTRLWDFYFKMHNMTVLWLLQWQLGQKLQCLSVAGCYTSWVTSSMNSSVSAFDKRPTVTILGSQFSKETWAAYRRIKRLNCCFLLSVTNNEYLSDKDMKKTKVRQVFKP